MADRKKGWGHKDNQSGSCYLQRTLFKHALTRISCYLLDRLMQMDSHTRITEDAVARILEETSESCYRKGGMNASITGLAITKTTVMNKIYGLRFPPLREPEKKCVSTLYIEMSMRIMLLCSTLKGREI